MTSKTPQTDIPNESVLLCVIMPALNEAATIQEVVSRVPKDIPGIDSVQVVVVDDGSTDSTVEDAKAAGALVISHPRNKGVGAAFQTGINHALDIGATYAVNIDSDGQFAPEDIPTLLEPLLKGDVDWVSASRFKDRSLVPEMDRVRYYGNKAMSFLISSLTGVRFHDVSCGFRAYSRDVLLQLNLIGKFTYTQESFLDLSFKGLHVEEIPIAVQGTRSHGKSRVAGNIPRYAYNTSKIIFRTFRDYYPMRIFGLGALLCLILSAGLFSFLLLHYVQTGNFTPHKWAGFTGAFFGSLGIILFIAGMLADMFVRVRINQERILYMMKKKG
jgi:glycosyltransferase involved in cell wall biosynthesis